MAKKLGLPQTKGEFRLRGNITGMLRDNVFRSLTTKTGKDMNIFNVGIQTNENSTTYVKMTGMAQDYAYFYKKSEEKGKKGEVKKVAWEDRFEDQGEGFNLIGNRLGLKRNDEGKNVVQTLTDYDSAETLYNNLNDDTPVMVIGELDFNSYKTKEGTVRRNKDFAIKQLYLSKKLDFNSEDFVEVNDFKQKIVFTGIEQVKDKEDPRFLVSAKIINYNNIQDTEFVLRNKALANTFRSKLKPYNAIDVWGKIVNKIDVDEEQEQDDIWGEPDPTKVVRKSYIRELEIIGADPNTIDKETYSKDIIDEALRADEEFGGANDDWGESFDDSQSNDAEDLPWN